MSRSKTNLVAKKLGVALKYILKNMVLRISAGLGIIGKFS
jgi:hypothetical protein